MTKKSKKNAVAHWMDVFKEEVVHEDEQIQCMCSDTSDD